MNCVHNCLKSPPLETACTNMLHTLDDHHVIESATLAKDIGLRSPQQHLGTFVFPHVYFLDANVFQQYQFELPRANVLAPSYLSDLAGDSASIRCICASYFNNTPFLSAACQPTNPADLTLLIVAMRLIMWSPPSSAGNAGVLITLYEFGHAIYPSAYFTVGECARYGAALGIDRAATLSADKSLSWVEVEERRRVWWAVLILDRLGNPMRSLAAEDPKSNYILRTDDDTFDQGTIHTLSSASSLEMGRFARWAQATHLLGCVLRHVSDLDVDKAFRSEERVQLSRTLSALVNLTIFEGQVRNLEFCTQTATCYCALLALQESYRSNNEEMLARTHQELQSAISAEAIARKTATIARSFNRGSSSTRALYRCKLCSLQSL
ncbi:hypothetical protein F5884DRAFT_830319 [Xylogone sp. PMI_703]|nr:hypothetical protein F5884DRAFT_830319 [Xylogone sp. PMI_703]